MNLLPSHNTLVASVPPVATWRPDDEPPRWLYAEQKLDGRRMLLTKTGANEIALRGRKSYIDHWPSARRLDGLTYATDRMPLESALVCEAHIPGVNRSGDVPAAIASGEGWQLTPLAPLFWDGKLTIASKLMSWRKRMADLGLECPRVAPRLATREQLLEFANDHGWEGVVLKLGVCFGWTKLKPTLTADLVVLSTYEHDHGGLLGGLVCGIGDAEIVRVGSGFTLEDRKALWKVRTGLVGQVCEIAYERRAAAGSLLFPRFMRWRDDKSASECDGRDL